MIAPGAWSSHVCVSKSMRSSVPLFTLQQRTQRTGRCRPGNRMLPKRAGWPLGSSRTFNGVGFQLLVFWRSLGLFAPGVRSKLGVISAATRRISARSAATSDGRAHNSSCVAGFEGSTHCKKALQQSLDSTALQVEADAIRTLYKTRRTPSERCFKLMTARDPQSHKKNSVPSFGNLGLSPPSQCPRASSVHRAADV